MPTAKHSDPVNAPEHYTSGSIECIEAIESQLTQEEYRGFLKGNVAKYLWRERQKGGTQSLEKAQWYLQALIDLDKTGELSAECENGFCPMPGVRYDPPIAAEPGIFAPISDA